MSTQNKKRQRLDQLQSLDDSMQSLISEFDAKEDSNINDLFVFMSSYLQKSEEYRREIYEMYHIQKDIQNRVEKLESSREKTETQISDTNDQVEFIERDIEKMKDSTGDTEASLHRLEQKQVDKDIYISGFPIEPNQDETIM